ncbi:MAG: hypothetical protein OEL78_05570 [Hyphomicrobiales bacterium]|nr:hypothetical protein [Hyphomicrobiales bacterium]
MAVTTLDSFAGRATNQARKPSLLKRMFQALIDARTLQAQHYVNTYLRSLDDKTLAKLGYDRADIV